MREPCDGKLSRTVLRGAWRGDTPSLLSVANHSLLFYDGVCHNVRISEYSAGGLTTVSNFIWSTSKRREIREKYRV